MFSRDNSKFAIDYIGLGNYKRVAVRNHPRGWGAGWLYKASGWPIKDVEEASWALCKSGKLGFMRAHGLWHDHHRFNIRHVRGAVRQAKRFGKLVEAFPYIPAFFSPWLEWQGSAADFRQCVKACREVLPERVAIINCRMGATSAYIPEVHGKVPPAPGTYFYSYDGTDCLDVGNDLAEYHSKYAEKVFYWCSECNGKSDPEESTPRHKRTHWLKRKHIKRMYKLGR